MANAGFEILIKSWGPFRIYQLISTANSAQLHSYKAGLAVLIRRWFQKPYDFNFFKRLFILD